MLSKRGWSYQSQCSFIVVVGDAETLWKQIGQLSLQQKFDRLHLSQVKLEKQMLFKHTSWQIRGYHFHVWH